MPYSKVSDAPANIRKLNGARLSLSQVNSIAYAADSITGVDKPWAVAIAQFKKGHTVQGSKWVKKSSNQEKKELEEFFIEALKHDLLSLNDGEATAIVEKNDAGTYNITTISTAAVKDREDETFTVEAMDYDIAEAAKDGDYPEFRVFHSKHLGFGKVQKMMRVGIFAIDTGVSYDDPFSLAVCEKMLVNNDGKWRVSRGFRVKELNGACPNCENVLSISTKHMLSGFRCPGCDSVHLRFKGILDGIQFTKARTFDVTVTDVPAVPMTGAFAWRRENGVKGDTMTKKELKKRLLEAKISEKDIDARLKELNDDQLAQLGDIPMAEILKEFSSDDPEGNQDELVVGFDEMVSAFKEVVRVEIEEALDGFQVEVNGLELEELKQDTKPFDELKELVEGLSEKVDQLVVKDESRLKDVLNGTSRNGKLRILRMKEEHTEDDDEEDEEDEEELAKKLGVSKETLNWIKRAGPQAAPTGDEIVDSSGNVFGNMTEMIQGYAKED